MKNLLIASLLSTMTLSAYADVSEVLSSLSAGNSVEQIFSTALENNIEAKDIVADLISAQPESVGNIITLAVTNDLDKAAEIVQAAVQANQSLATEIVQAAIDAGADPDEMLVAALLGGANEDDIALITAAGGFSPSPTLDDTPTQLGFGGGPGGAGNTASPN